MEVAERAAVSWNVTKYDDEEQTLLDSSGGWRQLEAQVNGDCVGLLLFLSQLKKRVEDRYTNQLTKERVHDSFPHRRTCMLAASYEGCS